MSTAVTVIVSCPAAIVVALDSVAPVFTATVPICALTAAVSAPVPVVVAAKNASRDALSVITSPVTAAVHATPFGENQTLPTFDCTHVLVHTGNENPSGPTVTV